MLTTKKPTLVSSPLWVEGKGEGACIEHLYPKHEPRFMVSDLS